MSYNLTAISDNSTNIVGVMQAVNNELMFGYLGILFLIAFFIISMIGFTFATSHVPKSMTAASFMTFCVALLLRALSMVPDLAIFITLVLTAASVALSWRSG